MVFAERYLRPAHLDFASLISAPRISISLRSSPPRASRFRFAHLRPAHLDFASLISALRISISLRSSPPCASRFRFAHLRPAHLDFASLISAPRISISLRSSPPRASRFRFAHLDDRAFARSVTKEKAPLLHASMQRGAFSLVTRLAHSLRRCQMSLLYASIVLSEEK